MGPGRAFVCQAMEKSRTLPWMRWGDTGDVEEQQCELTCVVKDRSSDCCCENWQKRVMDRSRERWAGGRCQVRLGEDAGLDYGVIVVKLVGSGWVWPGERQRSPTVKNLCFLSFWKCFKQYWLLFCRTSLRKFSLRDFWPHPCSLSHN